MSAAAAHDELLDEQRRLRVPWRRVLGTLLGLGTAQLRERGEELDRAFSEGGAAALLANRAGGQWRCDPIPFLFSEPEFSHLAAGLAQRAELLERVLADVYGPRTLLAEGVLPPSVVYPSPRYLRACRDWRQARHITLYAADLVRAQDGAWRVLADRTAKPGGLAYALENRRMMARVLPEPFRAVDVAPLRPFFDHWQDALQRLAGEGGAPALALLTPGHAAPRWFEHVVLARELGCTLVEAGDLTVRDGALFVKTLRGLQPVQVLLRWVSGSELDPLDVHADGVHGIPGLLSAMRSGAVHVCNSPGSAYAESPALIPFLPRLAQHLLGQTLRLQSDPVLWLGEDASREAVTADLQGWTLRPALDGRADPFSPDALQQPALRARLEAAPWEFAACKPPLPSFAPCAGTGDTLEPRGVIVRLFLLWDGTVWRPFPGGVALVSPTDIPKPGRLPHVAVSKDVWVVREEGADIVGPANLAVPPLSIRRMAGDMPSRVADNFYWFGRYLERLDNAARLARATLARLSRPGLLPREVPELDALCDCLIAARLVSREFVAATGNAMLVEMLQGTMARDNGPLAELMANLLMLSDTLRDRLSGEMHAVIGQGVRALKGTRLALCAGKRAPGPGLLADFASRILGFCASVSGYAAENMVRGGGRMFLDLGRRIERANVVATEVAAAIGQRQDTVEGGLLLALELCDSLLTYRSRYLSVVQPAPVLDLVLADEGNPRGLAYQLSAARGILGVLGGREDAPLAVALDEPLAEARLIVTDVATSDAAMHEGVAVAERLLAIASQLAILSDAVARQYFAVLPVSWTETLQ